MPPCPRPRRGRSPQKAFGDLGGLAGIGGVVDHHLHNAGHLGIVEKVSLPFTTLTKHTPASASSSRIRWVSSTLLPHGAQPPRRSGCFAVQPCRATSACSWLTTHSSGSTRGRVVASLAARPRRPMWLARAFSILGSEPLGHFILSFFIIPRETGRGRGFRMMSPGARGERTQPAGLRRSSQPARPARQTRLHAPLAGPGRDGKHTHGG